MLPTLPQDVIDCIIAQFGRERPRPRDLLEDYHSVWNLPLVDRQDPAVALKTLKALCLVCRSFRSTAVKYVFHTVTVTGQDRQVFNDRLRRLVDILQGSIDGSLEPKCAFYIRSISIKREVLGYFSGLNVERMATLEYMFSSGKLTQLFHLLATTNGISINSLLIDFGMDFGLKNLAFDWEQLPLPFRVSFKTLLQSPSLQILSIRGTHNVPQDIFHQSPIKALQLSIWMSPSARKVGNKSTVDAPQLDFLVTNDDFAYIFFEPPHWRTALSTLKGCNIDLHYSIIDERTLEGAKGSLESLRIDRVNWDNVYEYTPDWFPRRTFNPFNFGNFPNLRTLSITRHRDDANVTFAMAGISSYMTRTEPDDDIMRLVRMLEQSDCCPRLHTLTLRILDFYAAGVSEDFLVPRPPPGILSAWEEMDKVIASPSKFPSLRLFRLEMSAEVEPIPLIPFNPPFLASRFQDLTILTLQGLFINTRSKGVELDIIFDEIIVH